MERARAQAGDDDQEALAHICAVAEKTRVAMLTTITHDGQLRSRPLHTERVDADGTLWFIVGADAPKLREAGEHGGRACIAYADVGRQDYVSLSGTAERVDDPQCKAQLWSATAEVWFPGGKDSADVGVLRFSPARGEYWSGPASLGGKLLAFTRATLTGDASGFGTQRKLEIKNGAA